MATARCNLIMRVDLFFSCISIPYSCVLLWRHFLLSFPPHQLFSFFSSSILLFPHYSLLLLFSTPYCFLPFVLSLLSLFPLALFLDFEEVKRDEVFPPPFSFYCIPCWFFTSFFRVFLRPTLLLFLPERFSSRLYSGLLARSSCLNKLQCCSQVYVHEFMRTML